jgi:hypothetical protein
MSKEQDRLDRADQRWRAARENLWGQALRQGGWDWDTVPIYTSKGEREMCQVIAWHANSGRMLHLRVPEEYQSLELLDAITGSVMLEPVRI